MKKIFAAIILSIAFCVPSFAQSALYPLPASWSFRAVASFSQPRIAATGTLPAGSLANNGDLVFLTATDSATLYRYASPSWIFVGGIVPPSTATPTSPATGTLWMDGNQTPPKIKAWDGTSWNALW